MAKNKSSDSLYLSKLKFDPALNNSFMAVVLNNSRMLFLGLMTLILAGIFSFVTLPRELNPEVEIPIVTVVTTLPGANPLDVEDLITDKVENELESINAVDRMTSSSRDSVSIVTLEFSSTTDPDKALADVKEKVDLVTDLPDDASTPRVNKLDFNNQPVLQVALTTESDIHTLSTLAKELEKKLENSSSIRNVDTAGEEEEEIRVELDPEALQSLGVSAFEVTQLIESSNITIPAGTISLGSTEYQLSVDNTFSNLHDLRSLPLKVGQKTVLLSEIAEITLRSKETDNRLLYFNPKQGGDQKAVELAIYKSQSATITGAAESAVEILESELKAYPNIQLVTVTNTAQDISKDFDNLTSNFIQTVILVFGVLFAFLGFRQASTASLSIPLTFLSAFVIMNIFGITLNFLSLFSLLLALGLVVDDAIVIVQAAHSYGKKFAPKEMGLLVFRDFVVPIWTTTITTVWAFVPLLLSSGIIGEFIKSIPIVVTATLLSSTTIAVLINLPLTVIFADLNLPPRIKKMLIGLGVMGWFGLMMTVAGSTYLPIKAALILANLVLLLSLYFSRKELSKLLNKLQKKTLASSKKSILSRWISRFRNNKVIEEGIIDFTPISKNYGQMLKDVLVNKKKRWMVYASVFTFFIVSISFMMTGLLKTEFFPKVDADQLFISVEGPVGWNVEQTQVVIDDVREKVLDVPEVEEIFAQSGQSLPPQADGGVSGSHVGFITLNLPEEGDRQRTSIEVADEIRNIFNDYSQAKVNVVEVSGGPPVGADLQVNLTGEDLEVLESISQDFEAIMSDIPGAINISTSLQQSPGQIKVSLNEQKLRERDLNALQIGGWLRTVVTGVESSSVSLAGEDVDIIVKMDNEAAGLDRVKNLVIPSKSGSYTLSEVAEFSLTTSPTSVTREDGQRVVRVTAAAQGISATELLKAFTEKTEGKSLPSGYSWNVGGANEENQESTLSIIQAMGLSVILILVTMVLQLNSFRKSALVLVVIPLAVSGVFFNFTLFQIPLSFPALIGVLALFGIVVNNSIMLVEKINQNLRFGLPFIESIVDACASRIEPIFFTSLTTTIGLLPITLSDPLWRGLGGAIIAGLSVSGVLILFLLPAMYVEVFAGSEGKK